jgi:ubiquinone biosynthesis monooxygenase Coq6
MRVVRRFYATAPKYDVLVVGGGPTGASAACAVATHPSTRHLTVALLDSQPYKVAKLGDAPDARVLALSPASVTLLQSCGVWPLIAQSELTCQ